MSRRRDSLPVGCVECGCTNFYLDGFEACDGGMARINALEALVEAQDRLLIAYRTGDQRRGAKASADVTKARAALEQAAKASA